MKNNKTKQENTPGVYFTLAFIMIISTMFYMYSEYGIGFIRAFFAQLNTGFMDPQQRSFIFGVILSLLCIVFVLISGIRQLQKNKKEVQ